MKVVSQIKKERRDRRHARVRAKISGTAERPRLAVFKSNKALYVQMIDDVAAVTLASSSSQSIKDGSMKEKAVLIGKDIAAKAKEKKVEEVVFDRGGFIFTGNIKALADSAREAGLKF